MLLEGLLLTGWVRVTKGFYQGGYERVTKGVTTKGCYEGVLLLLAGWDGVGVDDVLPDDVITTRAEPAVKVIPDQYSSMIGVLWVEHIPSRAPIFPSFSSSFSLIIRPST